MNYLTWYQQLKSRTTRVDERGFIRLHSNGRRMLSSKAVWWNSELRPRVRQCCYETSAATSIISWSGSRMLGICSSYTSSGTAGQSYGYSRLLYLIPDCTKWSMETHPPVCNMVPRLSDHISIFVWFYLRSSLNKVVLYTEMRAWL